jgi:hypothetical protein
MRTVGEAMLVSLAGSSTFLSFLSHAASVNTAAGHQ